MGLCYSSDTERQDQINSLLYTNVYKKAHYTNKKYIYNNWILVKRMENTNKATIS